MIKLYWTVLLLLYFSFSFIAQVNETDSLKNELKNNSIISEQIDLLHQLVWELAGSSPQESIGYAKQSLQLSTQILDSTRIAKSYNRIGLVYDYTGNFSLAEKNYLKAFEVKKACDGYNQTDGILNNLGSIYYYMGQYEKSMEHYLQSLTIRENRKDLSKPETLKKIAQSYNNIGLLLKSQKNFTDALNYYNKAIQIKQELKDINGLIISYSNIGVILMQQDSFMQAKHYYQQAIQLADSIKDFSSKAMLFNNEGLLYERFNIADSANLNYQKAIQLYDSIQDYHGKSTALVNLASYYMDNNQMALANENGLAALVYGRQNNSPEVVINALHLLAKINQNNNPDKSLIYLNEYINLKDSVDDVKIVNKVNQMAVMYETEQKETQIELLEKEQEIIQKDNQQKDLIISKNNIYVFSLVIVIILLLVLGYFIFLYFRSKKREAEEKANTLHQQHQRAMDNLRNKLEQQLETVQNNKINFLINQEQFNKYLLNPLSERELEVLDLIADGLTNKEIGEKLFISVNTVKTHILKIYEKLDVQNRTAAAVKANSLQIIQ
jgi:ATP/maltotriose-dependent transcriptional regulator MalT